MNMPKSKILTDDELRALADWTDFSEGEGVGFREMSGDLAGGFPTILRDVGAAVAGDGTRGGGRGGGSGGRRCPR